jgi:hypothetical protein
MLMAQRPTLFPDSKRRKRWLKVSQNLEQQVEDLDERVKLLEQAVFELSVMAKYLKYAFFAMLASLGVDVQGLM